MTDLPEIPKLPGLPRVTVRKRQPYLSPEQRIEDLTSALEELLAVLDLDGDDAEVVRRTDAAVERARKVLGRDG